MNKNKERDIMMASKNNQAQAIQIDPPDCTKLYEQLKPIRNNLENVLHQMYGPKLLKVYGPKLLNTQSSIRAAICHVNSAISELLLQNIEKEYED